MSNIVITPFFAPIYSEETEIKKVTTNKIALIDADRYKHVVTYRVYQKIMDEGEPHSKALVNAQIDNYLSADIFNCFDADAYIFCFSAPSKKVFRNSITQEKKYKGNRENRKDPNFYTGKYEDMAYIYEYISSRYQTLFFDDLEADDLLSMLQRDETFIFSHDKDLKQVPGWHWNMDKNRLVHITETQGFHSLMCQMLKGDTTDNIPGLKGFGETALRKTLKIWSQDEFDSMDKVHSVMQTYIENKGLKAGVDTFVEMWTLLSMKINRGDWLKEKYASAFTLIETLCESNENVKEA